MIDPSFDTAPVTMTEYVTVEKLEAKVDQLNNSLASMTADRDFWQTKAHERMIMIDNLEEWIKEQQPYLDEDTVQSLVDIFGLELTKEYDVQVTVTFSGTVTAPMGYDMDALENALEARLDTPYYSHDVIVDFSEDSMDIDWTEC